MTYCQFCNVTKVKTNLSLISARRHRHQPLSSSSFFTSSSILLYRLRRRHSHCRRHRRRQRRRRRLHHHRHHQYRYHHHYRRRGRHLRSHHLLSGTNVHLIPNFHFFFSCGKMHPCHFSKQIVWCVCVCVCVFFFFPSHLHRMSIFFINLEVVS